MWRGDMERLQPLTRRMMAATVAFAMAATLVLIALILTGH
jgi:hypothetical protein